jgi:alkylhydroperoxidase family enzyme
VGSAVGRALGIADEQLLALMEVPAALVDRLRERFDEAQIVELAAAVAWEHYRARFNRVFGIGPSGFSEGTVCVLPER